VARIYRPGAKADHAVILEGEQGLGKSTALKTLASEAWFTDELGDIGGKDASMQLQGRLIVELAELDALSRAEVSRVKAFLSRSSDKFRPPWGRRVIDVPRQNVFAGTTNKDKYLQDETGARRFWPVRCTRIDLAGIERDRDQLWAEAVAAYHDGKAWWPSDTESQSEFREQQEERRQPDPWEEPIRIWLEQPARMGEITTAAILSECLGKRTAEWTRADEMRVAACMKVIGWKQDPRWDGTMKKKIRVWSPKESRS
jgi:predicted P-loop ATPase